jgi:nucleotide-binding universal stress UspA family protein
LASQQESLQCARSAYAEACSHLPNCQFQEIDADIGEAIERVSPYHDLIVLERLSEAEGPDARAFSAALWELRAVLVSPSSGSSDTVRHVAIAWNGSMQAGRALRAAMPYLRKAVKVTVLQRSGSDEDAELNRYLAAHAIQSVVFKTYGEGHLSARGWGRALLAETKNIGADLLVMGAYGSSMGNLLGFGRTTEKIVTSAPLPVLLSA